MKLKALQSWSYDVLEWSVSIRIHVFHEELEILHFTQINWIFLVSLFFEDKYLKYLCGFFSVMIMNRRMLQVTFESPAAEVYLKCGNVTQLIILSSDYSLDIVFNLVSMLHTQCDILQLSLSLSLSLSGFILFANATVS